MIELHLIGYTEDAEDLVLDLEADGDGRYTVRIDPDLLATVAQLREVRIARGAPVDRRPEPPRPAPAPRHVAPTNGSHPDPAATDPALPAPLPARRPRPDADPAATPARASVATRQPPARRAPAPTPTRTAAAARAFAETPSEPDSPPEPDPPSEPDTPSEPDAASSLDDDRPEHRPAALAVPHAQLSPAAIQAQLRAGRSVRAVAAEAGTDRAWIERWLPPIIAERERVLAEARRRRLDVPRARPLGVSVDRSLTERGVPEDRRTWSATRRADGRWRVSVRFEQRGRARTATWLMDPSGERVQAASPLAEELAGPGSRAPRRR